MASLKSVDFARPAFKRLNSYGVVNVYNLRFRVADTFFERHADLEPWMLPQFFEVWRNGKVILRENLIDSLGDIVAGSRDGSKEQPHVLIDLDAIGISRERLDSRQVTITLEETGEGSEEAMDD